SSNDGKGKDSQVLAKRDDDKARADFDRKVAFETAAREKAALEKVEQERKAALEKAEQERKAALEIQAAFDKAERERTEALEKKRDPMEVPVRPVDRKPDPKPEPTTDPKPVASSRSFEIKPPKLESDRVERPLPGSVGDVCGGGGGRFVILHLPKERK